MFGNEQDLSGEIRKLYKATRCDKRYNGFSYNIFRRMIAQ